MSLFYTLISNGKGGKCINVSVIVSGTTVESREKSRHHSSVDTSSIYINRKRLSVCLCHGLSEH